MRYYPRVWNYYDSPKKTHERVVRLKVFKGHGEVAGRNGDGGNKQSIRRIKTTDHIGDQVISINGLAHNSKLVGQQLRGLKVVGPRLGSLVKVLELTLQVSNPRARL